MMTKLDLHERFTENARCPSGTARWDPELKMNVCLKEKQMTTHAETANARQGLKHAAGNVVDARTKEHMRKTGEKDYALALQAVLAADPELKRNYLYGDA